MEIPQSYTKPLMWSLICEYIWRSTCLAAHASSSFVIDYKHWNIWGHFFPQHVSQETNDFSDLWHRKEVSLSWLETKKQLTEVNIKTEYSIVEEGVSNLCDYACLISKIIFLTHWGQVTHICICTLTIIGLDNALSPGCCQAIICTIGRILSIGPREQTSVKSYKFIKFLKIYKL